MNRRPWNRKQQLEVDGVRINVKSAGAGPRTVALIHGIGMSPRYFEPLAAVLAGKATVHAVELPGFGSSPLPSEKLRVADHAHIVAGALRQLGAGTTTVVGHSMGCQVAAEVAVQAPELVERLILLGPTVNDRERSARMQALRLAQDTFREIPAVNWKVFSDYLRSCIQYARTLPMMLEHHLEEALSVVECPVRLVRGERDPIAPADWLARLRDVCPSATVAEVPGEPHVMMYRSADMVARLCLTGDARAAV